MKRLGAAIAFRTGIPRIWGAFGALNPGFRVLTYHHILPEASLFLPSLDRNEFERQIEYVRRAYRIMPLSKLVSLCAGGGPVPARALALTFDDAFSDFQSHAWPILGRYGIPVTVFVPTGFIGTDRVPWPDELGYLFSKVPAAVLRIEIAGEEIAVRWNTAAEAAAAMQRLKEKIKKKAPLQADAIVAAIRGKLGVSAPNPTRILDRAAVAALGRQGVEFGSHTVSHALVGPLPPDRVWSEVADSRKCLHDILGSPPMGFCYPNGEPGDFTPETGELVKKAGYAYACTTVGGINRPGADPFEIKRCWTGGLRLESFAFRLAFGRF